MTIYGIDAEISRILSQVDENGELPDSAVEELMQLNADRETKIDNAACMVINLTAEAKAIREQEKALAERRKSIENRVASIKNLLAYALDGNAFSSPRVQVKFVKSTAVEIDPAVFWQNPAEMFIRRKDPEIDKTAITQVLKDGGIVAGASLVERRNIQIK